MYLFTWVYDCQLAIHIGISFNSLQSCFPTYGKIKNFAHLMVFNICWLVWRNRGHKTTIMQGIVGTTGMDEVEPIKWKASICWPLIFNQPSFKHAPIDQEILNVDSTPRGWRPYWIGYWLENTPTSNPLHLLMLCCEYQTTRLIGFREEAENVNGRQTGRHRPDTGNNNEWFWWDVNNQSILFARIF